MKPMIATRALSPTFAPMRPFRFACLLLCLTSALWAQREKLPPDDLAAVRDRWPDAERTSTGLYTEVLQVGTGTIHPKPGDEVAVTYRGSLLNGKVFDENMDTSKPFRFRLGRGRVIDGWEYGLPMMVVGEKRRLIIPYELGYGTRGRSPDIPRRATLIFEVELVDITRD